MLVSGKARPWGYQKGKLYGFENAKAYVLMRDNYTCQCCKTKKVHYTFTTLYIVLKA